MKTGTTRFKWIRTDNSRSLNSCDASFYKISNTWTPHFLGLWKKLSKLLWFWGTKIHCLEIMGIWRETVSQGVFFFLLGILGGVLAVVLGLVIVQQGRICIDWVIHTRRTLSRPPSYNTVAKPPRYSICGQWSILFCLQSNSICLGQSGTWKSLLVEGWVLNLLTFRASGILFSRWSSDLLIFSRSQSCITYITLFNSGMIQESKGLKH